MHLRFINGTRREGADHNEPSRITKLETIQKWWLCLPVYDHGFIFKRYWSNMIERLQVGKQSCCHRLPSGFAKRGLFYASTNKFWFKIKTDQQKHQWSLTLISKIALFQKSGFQTIIVSMRYSCRIFRMYQHLIREPTLIKKDSARSCHVRNGCDSMRNSFVNFAGDLLSSYIEELFTKFLLLSFSMTTCLQRFLCFSSKW